jgi:DNA mismatch repair protein MutS
LKIKYNKTFGYFIEVSNRFKDSVPDYFIRKQTLTTGERYITDALKEYEAKILGAEEKIRNIEYDLYMQLLDTIKQHLEQLLTAASGIAHIDTLLSFAAVAQQRRLCKPHVHNEYAMELVDARHPVIEDIEKNFVPNSCTMHQDRRFMIITGPNMAGKSTYMRQIALCIVLAQCGSYVPASKAKIALTDRIFTRVGATDDLTKKQSTFMVEMSETATILRHATQKSFIVLDEIGRGTSTYDGTALAWAVAEDLIHRIKAKTMFATHYHTLTQLDKLNGAFNVKVAVDEQEDTITFLLIIEEGGTDKSYGIHVAKLAGLPPQVIASAQRMQLKLEDEDKMQEKIHIETTQQAKQVQISKTKQKSLEDW